LLIFDIVIGGIRMSSRIKENLIDLFQQEGFKIPEEDIEKVTEFLDRKFCYKGETAIATIFLTAARHKKPLTDVLRECEKEWERNWKYQHPDIKGDPDVGFQNKISLENIYNALGLLSPSEEMQRTIPKQALVVVTENSTYRFGKAGGKGERTVSRDDRPLDFKRCVIVYLANEKGIQLKPLGGSREVWFTSIVREIQPQSE
jgi:hypothetical protein